jgi:hypothetical protein
VAERGFIRLAQRFGVHPSTWTAQHIHDAVKRAEVEDFDLDWKGELYPKSDAAKRDLAKDVAGLANHLGGVIVLGVTEDDQARASGAPGVEVSDDETARMRQLVASYVAPFPSGWDVRVIPDPGSGRGFYLLMVPQSTERPHAVSWEKTLRYPRRDGRTTRFLSETEVADMYRDRFARSKAVATRLDEIEGHWSSPAEGRAQLNLALAPDTPGNRDFGPERLHAFRQRANLRWNQPWEEALWRQLYVTLSLRRLILRDERPAPSRRLVLFDDGAGVASWQFLINSNSTPVQRWWVFAQNLIQQAVLMLEALVEHAVEAGVTGDVLISFRLWPHLPNGAPSLRLFRNQNEARYAFPGDGDGCSWGPEDERRVRVEQVVDLASVARDSAEFLIAIRRLFADVFQSFHAESGVTYISEAGMLATDQWDPGSLNIWPEHYKRS